MMGRVCAPEQVFPLSGFLLIYFEDFPKQKRGDFFPKWSLWILIMCVTGYGNPYWSYWWVNCTLVGARAPNRLGRRWGGFGSRTSRQTGEVSPCEFRSQQEHRGSGFTPSHTCSCGSPVVTWSRRALSLCPQWARLWQHVELLAVEFLQTDSAVPAHVTRFC